MSRFTDRKQAGEILGKKLLGLAFKNPVVLALPRGGLPVAAEIARELGAPLDILAVKKIGLPQNPEFALGAVSEDGMPVMDDILIRNLGVDRAMLDKIAQTKTAEVQAQAEMFRRELPMQAVGGRQVILVDDGLATGATMEAAIRVLRARRVSKITVAVPVASEQAARKMKTLVDKFVCLNIPEEFHAVGAWYISFAQVSDGEALEALRRGQLSLEQPVSESEIEIAFGKANEAKLKGDLAMPLVSRGLVIFAHGSGSSRLSPRNRSVAAALNRVGFATLLFDLLTVKESDIRQNVFDIALLAERLVKVTDWVRERYPNLPLSYFGASTGAGAAVEAAASNADGLFAIISRGGRVDLAKNIDRVEVPTLMIVGSHDEPVLLLNRQATRRLKNSKIAIVPGAGHLFVEPGALEEVIEFAVDWLQENLAPVAHLVGEPKEAVSREIERLARPLTSDDDYREFVKRLANSRIVMLGESSHGTQEFYEIRRKISEHLIRDHGFNFIAVEGDWPDCYALNRYIETGEGGRSKDVMAKFRRWPQWMWANTAVIPMIEWLRHYKKAGFYGLDVYSLFDSIEVISRVASKVEPELAIRLVNRYACFEPYAHDEIAYARSLTRMPSGCREEVITNLRELLTLRIDEARVSRNELFDLQQNARVIANAESYYRAMLEPGPESWNVRDEHMLETLEALLRKVGPQSKAIVWAHNTHIGDYHATDMVEDGFINIGGLVREAFGEDQVSLVGFGTYEGEVLAGRAWGAPEEVVEVTPAKPGESYEHYFHQAAKAVKQKQFACHFDRSVRQGVLGRKLGRRLGQRAIGVVYQSTYERSGRNYVPTTLAERYDAFVHVDRTTALTSLHSETARGYIPETWPSGQ
jgi:erythromycin esterase-like protein/predicted phosphoribosyltransferase/pimeloyl-ACP methyl ester carboxylesterase